MKIQKNLICEEPVHDQSWIVFIGENILAIQNFNQDVVEFLENKSLYNEKCYIILNHNSTIATTIFFHDWGAYIMNDITFFSFEINTVKETVGFILKKLSARTQKKKWFTLLK